MPEIAEVVHEYAIISWDGFVLAGPSRERRWNESMSLEYARDRWFPKTSRVVTRTITTYRPDVSDWSDVDA